VLGFSAFLAALGNGGGANLNCGGNPFRGSAGKGADPAFQPAIEWVSAHLSLAIGIGLVFLALCLIIGTVLQWLSARGQFMFLDCVTRNTAAVAEPWRQSRQMGNNLFVFLFLFGLAVLALIILVAGLGWVIARPDIAARQFGSAAIEALFVCVPLFVVVAFGSGLLNLAIQDFIVPIMYRRKIGTLAAFAAFAREILPGHVGSFVLFYLMRFVLALGAGILSMFVICLTCCIAALPYLSSVVLLPVAVFFRCYSLYFLAQFGQEWQFLPGGGSMPCASL